MTGPGEVPRDFLADAITGQARRLGIPDDAHLVLAVSGGPDSMALLHGAAAARTSGRCHWWLTVAHLDHGLRAESGDDAEFVRHAAHELGLPFELRGTDVAALARDEGRSLEDAGREARYRFLAEVAGAEGLIATGHTADDAAETILINLLRGSGLAGVRGIPARRGSIVRPLLSARRADLRAALDAAGIGYRLDPTNADPDAATRNRVRHELLPILERINPSAVEALARHARLVADDDALLDDLAAAELARRTTGDGEIDWHEAPAPALARRVLRLAIGAPAPTAERVDALLEAAAGDHGGLTIELGAGRSARVRGRRIRLE